MLHNQLQPGALSEQRAASPVEESSVPVGQADAAAAERRHPARPTSLMVSAARDTDKKTVSAHCCCDTWTDVLCVVVVGELLWLFQTRVRVRCDMATQHWVFQGEK